MPRNVLVTGAAKRLGAAIARAVAASGDRVVIHYGGSHEEADALARELGGATVQGDLADTAGIPALFERARRAAGGTLHALVNSASGFEYDAPAAIDPARTGVVAISKSGGTAETMTQFAICIDWLRGKLDPDAVGRHTIAITEPRDNPLRLLAMRLKTPILDHDPGIGGRYSVLSNVGLLPAMLAGLDVAALRAGAVLR